jgi:hypothetical protein
LGSWNSSTILFGGGGPQTRPISRDSDVLEGILTIGEQYQLDMSLEVFAETTRGTSRVFSNFGDQGGLTVNIRAESVPEPLTMLASATALGFGAFLKREHSKKPKKS